MCLYIFYINKNLNTEKKHIIIIYLQKQTATLSPLQSCKYTIDHADFYSTQDSQS